MLIIILSRLSSKNGHYLSTSSLLSYYGVINIFVFSQCQYLGVPVNNKSLIYWDVQVLLFHTDMGWTGYKIYPLSNLGGGGVQNLLHLFGGDIKILSFYHIFKTSSPKSNDSPLRQIYTRDLEVEGG